MVTEIDAHEERLKFDDNCICRNTKKASYSHSRISIWGAQIINAPNNIDF
jgi:hypothetical protein